MHVLVSRHQDGRLIGDMMRGFGLDLVHGSSSSKGAEQKGGASGLRALLAALAAGDQVVITPDGPRGPRRQVARGVAQLAALAGVPVLPVAMWGAARITSVGDPRTPPPDLTRGRVVDVSVGQPFTVPPAADLDDWTRYLGEVLTGMLEELQVLLPGHSARR